MKRICAICGDTINIDENNSVRAIQYKKKFYHFDCFDDMCDKRMANPRKDIAANWTQIKATINELVDATTEEQKLLVYKDNLCQWLFKQYRISFLSNRMYMKFDDVYNGALKGMAYAIGPKELLAEWQYYWDELCAIRRNKGITGEGAINYDLAVLLGKNAEYRQIKEKERVALMQQIEDITIVDVGIMPPSEQGIQRKNTSSKRANLFKEVMGDGE